MPVVLKKCVCDHKFQDKTYGKKIRVFNRCAKEQGKARCSVCKKEIKAL